MEISSCSFIGVLHTEFGFSPERGVTQLDRRERKLDGEILVLAAMNKLSHRNADLKLEFFVLLGVYDSPREV